MVGSIPLADETEVFTTVGSILPNHLRRVTDGETGERGKWVFWQRLSTLDPHPAFETVPLPEGHYPPREGLRRLRDDVDPASLTFPRLGYAEAATRSYATFTELRDRGTVPEHWRFQVDLPTPLALLLTDVSADTQLAVEPALERRWRAELQEILATVPPPDLAIQWDVCQEVGVWEGFYRAPFSPEREGSIERLVRLARLVPPDVQLGFHLCYGDYGHRHFQEPADAGVVVEMANTLTAALADRPFDWVHMPVPRGRHDPAYFEPLRNLELPPQTELYLGLVHLGDGVEGTRHRIATASEVCPRFGVATECGFGRRPPETIEELLRIHGEVAEPWSVSDGTATGT